MSRARAYPVAIGRDRRFGLGVVWCTAALVLSTVLAPVIQAQISTAAVVGTMTDTSGATLAGVKVTATNVDTGLTYSGETNTSGEFVIPALPPGRYRIQGMLSGFKTWQMQAVTLAVGDRFRADSIMRSDRCSRP